MPKVAIKREQSKLVWPAEREQLGRSPNKTKSIKKLNDELFCDKVRKREFIEVTKYRDQIICGTFLIFRSVLFLCTFSRT